MRPAITTLALSLTALLAAGCSGQPLRETVAEPTPPRLDPTRLRAALAYAQPHKRRSALRALIPQADSVQALTLRHLSLLACIEQTPAGPADRTPCWAQARELSAAQTQLPAHRQSDAANALVFVTDLARNPKAGAPGLAPEQQARIRDLCGPPDYQKGFGSGLREAGRRSYRWALQEACLAWLRGDAAAATLNIARAQQRAIELCYSDTDCGIEIPRSAANPDALPWQTFKHRLRQDTGIDLDAPERRLREHI